MEVFYHLVLSRQAIRQASLQALQGRLAHQQLELRLECHQVFWMHRVVQEEVQEFL